MVWISVEYIYKKGKLFAIRLEEKLYRFSTLVWVDTKCNNVMRERTQLLM